MFFTLYFLKLKKRREFYMMRHFFLVALLMGVSSTDGWSYPTCTVSVNNNQFLSPTCTNAEYVYYVIGSQKGEKIDVEGLISLISTFSTLASEQQYDTVYQWISSQLQTSNPVLQYVQSCNPYQSSTCKGDQETYANLTSAQNNLTTFLNTAATQTTFNSLVTALNGYGGGKITLQELRGNSGMSVLDKLINYFNAFDEAVYMWSLIIVPPSTALKSPLGTSSIESPRVPAPVLPPVPQKGVVSPKK